MQTYQTVAEYDATIRPQLNSISDLETRITIEELLDYAAAKEQEKAEEEENRKQKPRPDGTENAAYYRQEIDMSKIPSTTLQNTISELIDFVETLE